MLHPVMLGAVALLVLNDHVLKQAWPGAVTGKLSDIAGLCFFPVFLTAVWELLARALGASAPARRPLWIATFATAVVFTSLKLSPAVGELYRDGLGALQWPFRVVHALLRGAALPAPGRVLLTPDVTDLYALPAAATGLILRRKKKT